MKKMILAVLLMSSFAQAKEIVLQFNIGEHMSKMKTAIRESYKAKGLKEELVKRIELELHAIESLSTQSLLQNLDQAELSVTFSSTYVRTENDGLSDICTVTLASTVTFDIAGDWKVKAASCESND